MLVTELGCQSIGYQDFSTLILNTYLVLKLATYRIILPAKTLILNTYLVLNFSARKLGKKLQY